MAKRNGFDIFYDLQNKQAINEKNINYKN